MDIGLIIQLTSCAAVMVIGLMMLIDSVKR